MANSDIQRVLNFWFSVRAMDEPTIDGRMRRWFGTDDSLTAEIRDQFGELVKEAMGGDLDEWTDSAEGQLALILLLDQFARRLYQDSAEVFKGDMEALKMCQKGARDGSFRRLTAEQQIFFFMPLQRSESIKVQEMAVKIYTSLAERVSANMHDTFATVAQFAELRRDIVEQFGRFPHRNKYLGRANTGLEDQYLGPESGAAFSGP
jgi:uncharacterized protein (DUF924 family)